MNLKWWNLDLNNNLSSHEAPEYKHNFCRNPGSGTAGVWCYTTDEDTRFEDCDVPSCAGFVLVRTKCGPFWILLNSDSIFSDVSETCQDMTIRIKGENYVGPVSTTESGKTCQNWSKQSPHRYQTKNKWSESLISRNVIFKLVMRWLLEITTFAEILMVETEFGATRLILTLDGNTVMYPPVMVWWPNSKYFVKILQVMGRQPGVHSIYPSI